MVFGLVNLVLIAVGAGALRDLVAFSRGNDTASHVILVPFVTIVLMYQNREAIFASIRSALPAGSVVIFVGMGLLAAGRWFSGAVSPQDSLSISVAGLVVSWAGGFLLCYGREAARVALFPLLFLGFTIPIPTAVIDGATSVLKSGSTQATAGLFSLTGTPYFRQGFVFSLPSFVIEIADECSGIRSSIALLLTSLLAGHTFLRTPWTKTVLVLASLPVTVLKNGVRIVTLSLLAMHVDPGFLTGQLHHEGGIVFFLLALVMLAPVLFFFRRFELRPHQMPRP